MRRRLTRYVLWYMVAATFLLAVIPRVEAGFSPSEMIGQSQLSRSADIEKIRNILETKMIRERLYNLGFSQEEILAKLNQLTDDQIHQVALKLDEVKVGGSTGEVVLIIILIIALAALIFYMTGHRIIVK